ncbi:MAG TPA: ATP-binding protein [Candidatus Omnitrophota bacterium]|nr:ATP-binding protein [Candidatus Omnitrophota bacterium]HPS37261.1 ATP-binding protein [Candidatus Omnitrophota bacterium]
MFPDRAKEKKQKEPKRFASSRESLRASFWRLSIRYKLALPVLVLVFALVSFVLYTTFTVVRDMMVKYKEARLQTIAEIFSETLRIPIADGDKRALQAYIMLLAQQTDVDEVRVENAKGVTIGTSRPGGESFTGLFYKQDFFGVEKINADTYAAVAPIMSGDETLGRLIIMFSKIDFEQELKKVFREKFFIAFILTIVVTLVIAGVTWLVMRPLIVLQKTARNILSGDLEARANIHSLDEIQEVGDAFNKVVSRLVQSFEHLRMRTHALEESEEKYRSIVNEVSDIIFSITPEGEMLLLNRGFSGYTREELLAEGLPLFFLMHAPGEAQKFQDALEAIMRSKKPVLHLNTKQFHRLHHAEIYYQTNLTPVVDYEGSLRLIQGVMRDVTDLRRVEMMKETLVRDVAHELKTPTAKFIMLTQWLTKQMEHHPDREKFAPTIRMLGDNADRLMRTISSIMDLSKIESGMSDVRKQELDLNDVLRLVADDTRPLAEQHHLKVEAVLSPKPLRMLGDPDMLYRVFTNLVSNAIKFTPDGKITLSAELRSNDICAEVRDTGIGIEPENLEKIFEAFFQKTPSTLGIGVGLTISKEIVALHEGEIWAESNGAGQGSAFKVVFPTYQAVVRNP